MSFPIACLGGSAGSLEAFRRVVEALPPDCGVAVVIVNHVRRMPTQLPEILSSRTEMPVRLIAEGMPVQRDHIYVIPHNSDLTLVHGVFHLAPASKPYGFPRVIAVFLDSLAHGWSGTAIAVILWGLDSDGVEALRPVKAAGGITFAQEPETAPHPDMPGNAIATGCVDFVLPAGGIARELVRIACAGQGGRPGREIIRRVSGRVAEHAPGDTPHLTQARLARHPAGFCNDRPYGFGDKGRALRRVFKRNGWRGYAICGVPSCRFGLETAVLRGRNYFPRTLLALASIFFLSAELSLPLCSI
jgi:hypothetical protein